MQLFNHLTEAVNIASSFEINVVELHYSAISWITCIHKGVQPDVDYGSRFATTSGKVFGFFSAIGDVSFAFARHNVLLPIQASIPSTPEKPSNKPMWKGALIAYIVVSLCYFPVAMFSYWAFGNKVKDNVLLSLEKPRWLIVAANMFVVIHVVIRRYQV
ncbi:hypothetical protein Patl1_18248 [Pistacia atlantica]|uniref:Uncharacterized protein n=1 Tax=Pistacia atlantica TaxID=434234 RepID=A0ACC1BZS9_9ROSI|nr:hypothetical protein Patl1_18248 [Pistacia atlantica]